MSLEVCTHANRNDFATFDIIIESEIVSLLKYILKKITRTCVPNMGK